jgi:NADH dehydrogenase [ubiquinone] 1 alpha subcomplex assembly factor 1
MQSCILAYMLIGGLIMGMPLKEVMIFDFKNPDSFKPWQVVNDTVMGGVSQSSLQPGGKGSAIFKGMVSLKNNGGFCSASSRENKKYDLSSFHGIGVRVKGDGKTYMLTLKADASFNGYAYQFPFATQKDQWITVIVPFKDFVARFRGTPVPNAPPVKSSEITSFGFLIADKQEGPFALEIEWIKGVGAAGAEPKK